MARTIVVDYQGETSSFGISSLRREKLYGRKVKMIVDEEGNPTESAYLTRDGTALLPSGSMAYLYVDDDYDVTERRDLTAVDPETGETLEYLDSTLGTEQPLEGPVDPRRVLDHVAKAVYELDPEDVSDALRAALDAGDIFETRFNYSRSFDLDPAFILANDAGYFAIVGELQEFEFLYKEQAPAFDEDDDEDPFEGDELDFSMM